MNKKEQAEFVSDLTETIQRQLLDTIEKGKVPDHWDGYELRQWIVDVTTNQALWVKMASRRMKNYRNDVYTHNL